MKYFLNLLTFFCFSVATAMATSHVDYQVFEAKGKQGIKDNQGNVLIPAEYEELGWSKGGPEVMNNVIGYKSGATWGLITLDNEKITGANYTQLYPGSKGLLIAAMKGKFSQRDFLGVISSEAKMVLPFKYSSIALADLRAVVSTKEGAHYLYGVVDLSDRVVIPIRYKDISLLGNLRFAVRNFEGKTAIFNDKGKQILDFKLDSISAFSHGLAIIYDNHLRGLINAQGQIVVPANSKDFHITGKEVKELAFNEWSVLNSGNQSLATFEYDDMTPYNKGKIKVTANGKSWLIDDQGTALTPVTCDELKPEQDGHIPFRTRSRWGIMKSTGEVLLPAKFDSLFIGDDMIYARQNIGGSNKWSLFDTYGVQKSNHYYDKIGKKTQYLYPVSRQGYWGFIDRAGDEVIHCVYDRVSPFTEGLSVVQFHGETGVIDKAGEWVVLPQKTSVRVIDSHYYLTSNGKLTTLKSFEDGTIYFTENAIEVKDNYLLEHLSDGGIWKIDFEGRIFKQFGNDRYQEVRPPSEGFYAVKIDGKYGFIDAQNRLRIANRYDEVGPFKEGLAAIKLLGHWGFIDKRERIIIQPVYNKSSIFQNGLAIVETDNGVGLVNAAGEKVCAFEYDEILRQENGRFLVKKGEKYGLISETGKLLVNVKYDALQDLNNGFIIVKKFGKYGMSTVNGVDVIPIMYDELRYDGINDKYLGMKKSSWETVSLP